MFDLDTQLREYFEATTPAVEMAEIVARSERVAPDPVVVRPARRLLPGWATAVLATVVVVAAIGGAAWLLGAFDRDVDVAVTVPGIPSTVATVPAGTVPDAAAPAGPVLAHPPICEWISPAVGYRTLRPVRLIVHQIDGRYEVCID